MIETYEIGSPTEEQEALSARLKAAIEPCIKRPHFKPRVVFRGDHWFITVSVSPKFRGDYAVQVALPERVDEVKCAIKALGLAVEQEEHANTDPDHVQWLMAAMTDEALESGRQRRHQWFTKNS